MRVAMLTTTDNPYDPFDQFELWDTMDQMMGYYSSSYLARIVITTEDLGLDIYHSHIEDAIDEIVEENITGTYVKVVREVENESVIEV